MIYNYEIKKKAMKFIEKQEKQQQARIFKAIYSLPLIGDVKKLAGEDNLYRLRVGDYRIIYTTKLKDKEKDDEEEITIVTVTDAGNRGQIYK